MGFLVFFGSLLSGFSFLFGGGWGGGSSVVGKMSSHEVTSSEGGDEGEFACHNRGSDDSSKLLSVASRAVLRGTSNAEHREASRLTVESCTTAHSSNFDAGHGHGHMDVVAIVHGFHDGHASRALHVLSWILSASDVDCCHNVGGVGVETSNRPSYC